MNGRKEGNKPSFFAFSGCICNYSSCHIRTRDEISYTISAQFFASLMRDSRHFFLIANKLFLPFMYVLFVEQSEGPKGRKARKKETFFQDYDIMYLHV